jgi:hypothetical protein
MLRRLCTALVAAAFAASIAGAQETPYRVKPVASPELKRPAVQVSRDALPRGATGALPTYDGEPLHLNLPARGALSDQASREIIASLARAFGWTRADEELKDLTRETQRGADPKVAEAQARAAREEARKRVSGTVGKLTPATEKAIEEQTNEMLALATRGQEVVSADQRVNGVRVEFGRLQIGLPSGGDRAFVTGSYFGTVNLTNQSRVPEAAAVAAARAHVGRSSKLGATQPGSAELVILPYGDSMRFAWRIEVAAEEGSYRLWVDAETRAVLRLEPLFASDSAGGLTFNPNPNAGTLHQDFEVDGPSGGNYRLVIASNIDANNSGADGVSTGDVTVASGGGSANFDASPINGTVVERTNQASYNSRFQEVNAYAWVFSNKKNLTDWGSRTYPAVTVTVNHNNPCGFGIDNACGGSSAVTFGVGSATTSTSTSANALFNSAIDATVVSHEFGHVTNRLQLSGISVGALDEGLGDFWAATFHNNDTMGGWWKHNGGSTPVQTGFVPRQAEPQDVFPEHRAFQQEAHADGQIIDWAMWSTRTGLNNQGALGTFLINVSLLKALTTASAALSGGASDKGIHDAYLNLLQQLLTQITSASANKLLSGFARAGITLSERDAIIDISDDFLASSSATGPTFTVFGGRDYQFSGQTANAANVFNSRYQVEVANDAAFTVNHVTSPFQTNIVVSPQGVPLGTWTLPTADWNTVKGGTKLFYRVTTTDAGGGNSRVSTSPGNGFVTVPVPSATINASGECECSCATAPVPSGRYPDLALWTLVPLLIAWAWRRRLRGDSAA